MKQFICLDNNGETFDRYTIINPQDGEMIGASANPFHPMGFGQHCGNIADNYWKTTYGSQWKRNCTQNLIDKRVKYAIDHFLSDCEHIGRIVEFDVLPDAVQKYAQQCFEYEIC